MLKVILDEINGIFKGFQTAIVIVVLVALSFWVARCTARKDAVIQERIKVLTHTVKVADSIYVHDTVTAYRTRIRYDRTRIEDTLAFHDTVWVPRVTADSAINSCTEALHDCEHIRLLNDSLTKQLVKQKPGFWSKIGVSVGPSIVAARDGTVKVGIGATFGWKVWP